jgi:hypothetical protein
MFELKPLSRSAVPAAMAKAERYRLLNQPRQAASICEDILRAEPEHHDALITLLLSLTEVFSSSGDNSALTEAQHLLPRLRSEYEQAYYAGIIYERRALALLAHATPGSGFLAYDWLHDAMHEFERAERVRPPDNDDAILRWNACARVLMRNPHLRARSDERDIPLALE